MERVRVYGGKFYGLEIATGCTRFGHFCEYNAI